MDSETKYIRYYSGRRRVPSSHYREVILNVVLDYCKREKVKKIVAGKYENDIIKSLSSFLSYIILIATSTTILEAQANCLAIKEIESNSYNEIPKEIDHELIQFVGEFMNKENILKICKIVNKELDVIISESTAVKVCSLKDFSDFLNTCIKHILRPNFYDELQILLKGIKKESGYLDYNFRDLKKFNIRKFGEWCNMGIMKSCVQDLLPIIISICFDNDKVINPMLDQKILHCIEELHHIHEKKDYPKKLHVAFSPIYEYSLIALENYPFK
ncbi:Hypothetical protein SRAE_1000247200 [Strongyloides ratti]|uniref:Uncharacterized protein n=1 Tax=Strongyloides ratti TaxID=34506 RepID=A0A090L3F7_STRRB|nr:Hypothetical protein SRAE_1000247200 [Strongyloides ratti]CEF64217.1 Hypothetical protein SRAE_1000247200 [Strongyloides ratti]